MIAPLLFFLMTDPSPPLRASVECARLAAPGRVRCDLEARVDAPRAIRWGDVEVVGAPAFLAPLKGRIGPGDATAKDAGVWRWSFALVAREAGEGDVALRVRLVVCDGDRCAPRVLELPVHVVVGR